MASKPSATYPTCRYCGSDALCSCSYRHCRGKHAGAKELQSFSMETTLREMLKEFSEMVAHSLDVPCAVKFSVTFYPKKLEVPDGK